MKRNSACRDKKCGFLHVDKEGRQVPTVGSRIEEEERRSGVPSAHLANAPTYKLDTTLALTTFLQALPNQTVDLNECQQAEDAVSRAEPGAVASREAMTATDDTAGCGTHQRVAMSLSGGGGETGEETTLLQPNVLRSVAEEYFDKISDPQVKKFHDWWELHGIPLTQRVNVSPLELAQTNSLATHEAEEARRTFRHDFQQTLVSMDVETISRFKDGQQLIQVRNALAQPIAAKGTGLPTERPTSVGAPDVPDPDALLAFPINRRLVL
jgi:hypothetical protein